MSDPVTNKVGQDNQQNTKPQANPDPTVSNWVASANRSGWQKLSDDVHSVVDRVTDQFRRTTK